MLTSFRPSRRLLLQLLGSAAVLPALGMQSFAQSAAPAGRILILSDLHSAYERSGYLLAALRAEVAAHAVPHLIVINGDVFESGNVVAARSGGIIDWAFLKAVADLAPTVLNIGNHEPDLTDDLSKVVAQAQKLGITVVSNIVDTRTGTAYAPATAKLALGDLPVQVTGIATAAVTTYPKAIRETLTIADPVAWATANLSSESANTGLNLVLSHAGVVADRAILPLVADGSLVVGGHDHLLLTHDQGRTRYVHTGSWSSVYSVAEISTNGDLVVRQTSVPTDTAPDTELSALIETTLAEHLTAEELASIGTAPKALSLAETGRFVAATMATGTNADVGFIGHTTLGTGLPQGDVSRYAFNSVVRFDGDLMIAEVSAPVLAEILARANQDGPRSLDQLTGDFLYASPRELPPKDRYTIVANDWSATNQKSYFGREDLVFAPHDAIKLKALVIQALS